MKNYTLAFVVAIVALAACKKSSTKTDAPKTLTKALLYDKTWYNQGKTISHKFNSNGSYGSSGTWKWLNNSDSMEVKFLSITQIWYFDWSAEHEMQCRYGKTGTGILFKDVIW